MALPRAILFDLDETLLPFGHRPTLLAEFRPSPWRGYGIHTSPFERVSEV